MNVFFKKFIFVFFVMFCISFLFLQHVDAAPNLSIDENDYQLVCTYNDGVILTISRDDVYFQNTSISANSTIADVTKFYLAPDQENVYSSMTDIVYNHSKVTENGHCPSILYTYEVESKYDATNNDDEDEDFVTAYYSTKNNIVGNWGQHGWLFWKENNAKQMNYTSSLSSEEVYLITDKETLICDYNMVSDDIHTTNRAISVFLYGNLTIAQVNGRMTTLSDVWSSCQQNDVYVNDPAPKAIADNGSGVGIGYSYNHERFFISPSKNLCETNNDGQLCNKFQYLGEREGDSLSGQGGGDVCQVLGNETIEQIKRVINILQVIVPVLTIVLTGFDLSKIIVSGNIDEELPKKRKVIVIRLILMAFFFFLPLIANLIISGLQNAGVIGIEEINCITEN